MATVQITMAEPNSSTANNLTKQINDLVGRLRHRAYHIFEARGGRDGSELGDWLRAEEEILVPIRCSVTTTDTAHQLSLSIPDFNPADVQIYTLGDTLVVKGDQARTSRESIVNYSEDAQSIFYQWQIPAGSVLNGITAQWDKDTLIITVPRSSEVHDVKLLPPPELARSVAA